MGPLFSNVSPQLKAIFQEQSGKPLSLRQGQVILGKIKEILPNNVAVVQFGKHQVTAKLEVPISLDQPYLFEVISIDDMPQLRVIAESNLNRSISGQIEQIITNLKLNPSREQRQFINEVINNQIPFQQADLKLALELFKNDQTQVTKEQLIGMLKNQLPITEVTLNAIKAVNSNHNLSSQMEALYQTIKNQSIDSETTQALLEKLTFMLSKGSKQELDSLGSNQTIENLNHLFEDGSSSQTQTEAGSNMSQGSANSIASLNLNQQEISDQLTQQLGLTDRQIYQLKKVLTLIADKPTNVTNKTIDHLQNLLANQSVGVKLVQQLPTQAAQLLETFIQQPDLSQLSGFVQPLRELVELQLSTENQSQLFHLLSEMNQIEADLFPVKEQFLIHLKNYLLNSGIDFEHQIYQQDEKLTEQQTSLKQLLLQTIADQSVYTRDADQLVNLLTGQQLTLLNEDASFLHVSMTMPGMFGSIEDMNIEFYSRKDQDEKIDPDYCRIAFYLELAELKTTIIDLNVQNRLVHLTVYNDQDISNQLDDSKPLLKKGLEKFNYHLSSISHKPLPENKQTFNLIKDTKQLSFQTSQLDVRI